MTNHFSAAQARAARALAGVTAAQLAAIAGVGERTVAGLEAGDRLPNRGTVHRLLSAFASLGIEVLPETDRNGAGVRFREPGADAGFIRRDALKNGAEIGFVFRHAGRPATGRVVTEALAADPNAALAQFDLRRPEILTAATRKLAGSDFDARGHVVVGADDLAPMA